MASKLKKLSVAADIFDQDIEGMIRKIPLSEITPSHEQPRKNVDVNLESLAQSIREEGLLQPIVVTKVNEKYTIIAGERRFRACRLAGLTEVECRILKKNASDTYRLAVIENLQREDLDPFDEAESFKKLKDEYQHTDGQIAQIVGKSRNYISEILSIAEIPSTLLKQAKDSGVTSRNLLIQLAQAAKAGTEKDFLHAFNQGEIKTVASAKKFNQTRKKQELTIRPQNKKKATIEININQADNQFQIAINVLGIRHSIAAKELKTLEDKIHSLLDNFFT